MDTKVVGNRRTEEELEKIQILNNKTAFTLEPQKNFIGTEYQLEAMQNMERSYIAGKPLVSDEEWEILKHKHNYEESLTSVAPSGRNWIKLLSPLPSIDKAGSRNDMETFLNKFDSSQLFKIECKLDGLTSNLRYKLDSEKDIYTLESISSRGNGRYGLEINPYALEGVKKNWPNTIEAKYIKNIYEFLNKENTTNLPEFFEIRGEAVIKKNEHNIKKYGENAVLRSVASGMFTRKVPANLNGLMKYLFNSENLTEVFDKILKDNNHFGERIKLLNNDNVNNQNIIFINDIADARLIYSLSDDPDRFLRNDKLFIRDDSSIIIKHLIGTKNTNNSIEDIYNDSENYSDYKFKDDGEELDIVFYSMSFDGSNIDTDILSTIPSIKTVSDIDYCYSDIDKYNDALTSIPKVYTVTNDRDKIWENISNFYGTDFKTGKRDFNKLRTRNMYEYAIDGVVIKPVNSNKKTQGLDFRNSKNNPNKIVCPKYPEDQIAVKLLSEMVKVKLIDIVENETSLGNITCTGILDKAYLTESGAMVSNINLHNPEWLKKNYWIQPGNEYYMVLSLDIIPVLMNPDML